MKKLENFTVNPNVIYVLPSEPIDENEAIKTSILWSTVFCVIFGVILALFPAAIVSRFTKGDAEMIRIGAASLRANGISIMLFTVVGEFFLPWIL